MLSTWYLCDINIHHIQNFIWNILNEFQVFYLLVVLLFSWWNMSDSLWPRGLQHARLPCPSPSPRVWPNSCPLSPWRRPTISSSAAPFSLCLQSFSASVSPLPTVCPSTSFPMSQLCSTGGQSIGAPASASVLPVRIQGWFPLGLTGLISLLFKGL